MGHVKFVLTMLCFGVRGVVLLHVLFVAGDSSSLDTSLLVKPKDSFLSVSPSYSSFCL